MSDLIGTQSSPPVIKENFGSDAWVGITSSNPPTVIITDQAGAVQAVDTGSMTQIPGTPMWYYTVADRVIAGIPAAATEWTYYVTAGVGNEVVADGNISIGSAGIAISAETITSHRLILPTAIQLPSSVSAPKIQPIQFSAYSVAGDIMTLDSVTITIGTLVVAAAMTATNNIWKYNWTLTYSDTPEINEVIITSSINSDTTDFPAVVETFRPKEFSAQRLSSGLVT